jgi:hypothetical protein
MKRGFLYLAKGEEFVTEAITSARRVSEVMQECPITLVSDQHINAACFDRVIVDQDGHSLADKPRALQQTPYERTVFLDTDIHMAASVSELFEMLDEYELALRPNRDQAHVFDNSEDVPWCFPEFNSGVVAYRDTPAVMEMLSDWEARCRPEHGFDQYSLRKAIYDSSVCFAPIPTRYNCMYNYENVLHGSVKLYHGPIVRETDDDVSIGDATEALSKSSSFRYYTPYESSLVVDPPLPLLMKLRLLMKRRGVAGTSRVIIGALKRRLF